MNERKIELDVIRVIACFFVVVIHVAGYGMEVMDPMTGNWMVRNLVVCAVRCAVPIFFMLSGVLFLEKKISVDVLYKKYIFRILVAWVFWSGLYAMIDYIACRKTGEVSIGYFLSQFLKGHYHMWFLAALLTAYIFLPILQQLIDACSEWHMKYLSLIILIGVIMKETLELFLGGPTWDTIWNNLNMLGGSKSVIYFVLGYYLYRNYNRFSMRICTVLYITSVVAMSLINVASAYVSGAAVPVSNNYLSLGVLVSSSALFMLLVQKFTREDLSEAGRKWIYKISKCTFGVYLVHTLFIEQVYRRVGLTQDFFPVIPSIILFSAVTFLLSIIVTWVMRKIPILGRWIT